MHCAVAGTRGGGRGWQHVRMAVRTLTSVLGRPARAHGAPGDILTRNFVAVVVRSVPSRVVFRESTRLEQRRYVSAPNS